MYGLFRTINDQEPKWKLSESRIGTNPGLGFRPMNPETKYGSVIQFDRRKPEEADYWIERLESFLKPYHQPSKRITCTFNNTHQSSEICDTDLDKYGPCSPKAGYGFKSGHPCVFLKLNRIYDWVGDYYTDPNNLPADMPLDLVNTIKNATEIGRKHVWVSCHGFHAIDSENIGKMSFYPDRGFPDYHYPYRNQPDYLSPLIAVQFESLKLHQLVNIECRAWAKNILYGRSERVGRMGSVIFQILID